MNKITISVTLRAGIATALCLSFIIYPALRVSSKGAATRVAADLKSESQYRSEASRFDGAISAIGGIATMKLETPDDLKKAIAILDRERPNLKLSFSKLVVLALSDSTFIGAVKKRAPDKRAAEAFLKELEADLNAVLKLDGAESLKTRMQRRAESDAATLRRAGERLKEAAERIKKASQGGAAHSVVARDKLKVIRAGFREATQPTSEPATLVNPVVDPVTIAIVFAIGVLVLGLVGSAAVVSWVTGNPDKLEACQKAADTGYLTCVSEANDLPTAFGLRDAAKGLCYAAWLAEQAECLLLYL